MSSAKGSTSERWVLCFLVTGDLDGVNAVSAEGLMKTALLNEPGGAQPVVSTVTRFSDMSDNEQARWRLLLQRDAEDW